MNTAGIQGVDAFLDDKQMTGCKMHRQKYVVCHLTNKQTKSVLMRSNGQIAHLMSYNQAIARRQGNFMRKIAIILTFLVLPFPISILASGSTTEPAKTPNAAPEAKSTSKKVWMENMQNNLPTMLCQKDQYFLKCFSIDAKECVDMNKLFVQACLNNAAVSLPSELTMEDAKHWGAVIGKCTLDVFEKFLPSKKLKTAECTGKEDKADKTDKSDKAKPKK